MEKFPNRVSGLVCSLASLLDGEFVRTVEGPLRYLPRILIQFLARQKEKYTNTGERSVASFKLVQDLSINTSIVSRVVRSTAYLRAKNFTGYLGATLWRKGTIRTGQPIPEQRIYFPRDRVGNVPHSTGKKPLTRPRKGQE